MRASSEHVDNDRRSKPRFPVNLKVRFRTINLSKELSGEGNTINMSSQGLLVAGDCKWCKRGSRLELILEWPLVLEGSVPLQLVIFGRVSRRDETTFAIEFRRYQFRTKRRHSSQAASK